MSWLGTKLVNVSQGNQIVTLIFSTTRKAHASLLEENQQCLFLPLDSESSMSEDHALQLFKLIQQENVMSYP
jgi:hypothetical protein